MAKEICQEPCVVHGFQEEFDPTLYEITVPRAFFEDHENRELVSDHAEHETLQHNSGQTYKAVKRIKQNASTVTVRLTLDDIAELRSDANHYWLMRKEFVEDSGIGVMGLCMSAKATRNRIDQWLEKQEGQA
jgi:hypothetical protein